MNEVLPEVFHSVLHDPIREIRLTETDWTHLCGLLKRFANGMPSSPQVSAIAGQFYKHLKEARKV